MEKHFKKRLAAFKVGLVLSIMITPFCFYKLSERVSALTNVITYNQYGSFTRTNTPLVISGSTNFGLSTLDGNLQGKYSGSLTINYSIASGLSISNFSVITEDCWITYYDSSSMNIQFNDVSHFSVSFQRTSGATSMSDIFNSITINSLTNWNMNMITYGDNFMQSHIYDSVDGLEAAMSTANSTLSRCETLLNTISQNGGSGGSGGSSTVNNIDINVDHIADDLNLLKASNDSILDELLGFLTDSIGHVITMENLIDAIETTTTALTGISNQLTSMQTTLNSINSTLININTAVQNIDNTIDTITWLDNNTGFQGASITLDGSYSKAYMPASYNLYLKYTISPIQVPTTTLYKITIPYLLSGDLKVRLLYANGNEIGCKYFILPGRMYTLLYLYDINAYSNVNPLIIEISRSNNTRFTSTYYGQSEANNKTIDQNDIEYWDLVSYFDQYTMQREILTALQQLSINVHGDIIQQTEQVINNYDTSFNSIHNIESNFVNNFDSTNPGVISLLNSNLQIPNGFIDGSNFIKTLFPKVVDNSSLVGFPYFLILAIVVLIVLLG